MPDRSASPDSARPEAAKPSAAQPAQPQGQPQPRASQPNDPAASELARAQGEQKAIADELQKMLDSLGEFETYRGVVQEAKGLLNEQKAVNKSASETTAKEQLEGKKPEQLTPEQKAELDNLGARQGKVSESLQQLENKMDELARRP